MGSDSPTARFDEQPAGLTLPDVFRHAVGQAPEAVAIITPHRSYTWRQWQVAADATAYGLQQLGVAAGDIVAAQLPNSFAFLALHTAVAAIGGVLLPLPVDCGWGDLESTLTKTEPKVLIRVVRKQDRAGISAERLREAIPTIEHVFIVGGDEHMPGSWERFVEDRAGREPSQVDIQPEQSLVLIRSSGTTSARPKICEHSHRGLLSNARAVIADSAGAQAGDTIVSASPFSFLFGLLSVHVSILTNAEQMILESWDKTNFLATAAANHPTVLFAVPTQLHDIVTEINKGALPVAPRFRQIRTGGSLVPGTLVDAVLRLPADEVVVQWGMSEIGAGTCTRPGDPIEMVKRSVGQPIGIARVRVTDDDDRPVGDGMVGHLQFRGSDIFSGYHRDSAATEEAVTDDGWLRTGDLASIGTDGVVTLHGRSMDVVNVGGRKVNAVEVENLLADFAGIEEAIVVGRSDTRLGEVPVVVCTATEAAAVSLEAMIEHLVTKGVARYQLPVAVTVVERLPHTPTGKIARRQVRNLVEDAGASQAGRNHGRESHREQLASLIALVCEVAGRVVDGEVAPDVAFGDQGFDSHAGIRLRNDLATITGRTLPDSLIFDQPTPRAVARYLLTGDAPASVYQRTAEHAAGSGGEDAIAIIGMSCRLPGAIRSPEDFWELLATGGEVRSELPRGRGWPVDDLYAPQPTPVGKVASPFGGFLESVAEFDAEFFGITVREARSMDPQQRVLLETTWETLERSGITREELRDSDTGVFVGMMASDYMPQWFDAPEIYDGTVGLGTAASVASGRLAYLLGLRGPALTVDTACSSSLVALHLAVQALRNEETGMAIVGGVTVMSSPANLVEFSRQGLLAPDGRCKPFAFDADGVGLAEGAGVVILQRLSDAQQQGRQVLAIVRGSAVAQDGAGNGLAAPNQYAQELVVRRALRAAELAPLDIDAVEAHGTGTALGDSIEIRALLASYGVGRERTNPLWVGSAKSNIGHTQAAAGIVSVIKMVLALQHSVLPRTLHADRPNEAIDWSHSPVQLLTESVGREKSGRIRRVAVSSFGIAGTNSHVILEQAPPAELPRPTEEGDRNGAQAPWVLSAKTPAMVQTLAARLHESLDTVAEWSPAAVGNALANGRSLFPHRAAVLPDRNGRHDRGLPALANGTPSRDVVIGSALPESPIAFIFPGHGTYWPAMATQLLAESKVFAATISECEKALAPYVPWSLGAVLLGDAGTPTPTDDPEIVQSATFAVMVALAALWRSHGVVPDVVVGHSQGEIAAAYVAGALSLSDAARIVTARARVLSRISGLGGMASLAADRAEVADLLSHRREQLGIAVVNGPRSIVVSGDRDTINELLDDAQRAGINAKRVPGDIAFHSPHVEGMGPELDSLLSDIRPKNAQIPFYSATSATQVSGDRLVPEYWYRNMREPVDLDATTRMLSRAGFRLFIEVSPHPVLCTGIEQTTRELGEDSRTIAGLRRDAGGMRQFLRSVAEAHVHGATVNWRAVFGDRPIDAGTLPTYPFRSQRFWLPSRVGTSMPTATTLQQDRYESEQPAASAKRTKADLLGLVVRTVATVREGGELSPPASATDFEEYGLSSLDAIEVRNVLAADLGVALPATVVMDHRTPEKLVDYLAELPPATDDAAPSPALPASPAEDHSESESELPSDFEALYRKLCVRGHIDAAWEMVGHAAVLRSFFSSTEARSIPVSTFRHVSGRTEPALACFPSIVSLSGTYEYRNFSAPFAGMRNVVQLDDIGCRDGEKLPHNLDAFVAAQVEALNREHSDEALVLCGRSFGGWIAHATATRMAELGHPPAGVVLLDTFRPSEEFVGKFIPRTLRLVVDYQEKYGDTAVGMARLTAVFWYLRMLRDWQPIDSGVPTLCVLPEDRSPVERHLHSGGWQLPHTEVSIPADHISILNSDSTLTAEAIEEWLSTLELPNRRGRP